MIKMIHYAQINKENITEVEKFFNTPAEASESLEKYTNTYKLREKKITENGNIMKIEWYKKAVNCGGGNKIKFFETIVEVLN